MFKNKGFTMIEILLVVGIAVSIFFLSAPFGLNFYRTQVVEETQDNINTALQRARHNAILQKNDSSFGVKFNTTLGSYTIFQGISFAERVTDQDEIFYLPAGITLEVPDGEEIVFSKLTGTPNSSGVGSISINLNGVIKTITVDENGLLSKLDKEVIDEETGVSILVFDLPGVSSSLIVNVTTFTASDGVAGFFLSESSSAPSADDNGWTGTAPTSYTFSTAGSKTLYAWVKNVAGTISDSASDSVTITLPDTTAPIVTAFTIPSTSSSLTISDITFTASDTVGVTGYIVTESASTPNINDSDWTSSATTTFVFASEGTKTLYAWAKDAAGNISASASDSVVITLPDTTAPVVDSFIIVEDTSLSLTVDIGTFTATDAVGVTGYKITESDTPPLAGDAGWTETAPTTFVFASEGTKTLYAWAKDAAGNISASASETVEVITGLVSYWSFDGDADDDWGDNDATVISGATLATGIGGSSNTAYDFTGGNYIQVPNSDDFDLGTNMAISFWYKTSSAESSGSAAYVLSRDATGVNAGDASFVYDSDTLRNGYFMFYEQTPGVNAGFPIADAPINQWHHVVFTKTGASGSIYLDGVHKETLDTFTNNVWVNDTIVGFGNSGLPFDGLLDEVKVYNRALSADEIVDLYESNLDTSIPTISNFVVPSGSGSLTIPITTFTATDNIGLSGYKITESATAPLATATGWTLTAPTSYTFTTSGAKTLYAWVKDTAGNVSVSSSANTEVIAGLVSYWSFDGNANDNIGSNNGTVTGAVLGTGVKGVASTAYSFDGNDYITVADSDSLDITSVTMCSWINSTSGATTSWQSIMAKRATGSYPYGMNFKTNLLQVYTSGTAGISGFVYNVSPNTWTHVCGIITTNSTKLYINGSLFESKVTAGGTFTNTSPLYIGSSTTLLDFFSGLIDNVRVYNQVLTDAEISIIYNLERP
jgi:type II secretory pathway pseudopilin PulG